MEPQFSVLLYSKYSNYSNQLMDLIKRSGVDFTGFISQFLCVDNSQIRQRIVKNKDIDISSVPCLLIVYPNGGVEKYDGSSVFDWANQIIQRFKKSLPPDVKSEQKSVKQENKKHRRNRIKTPPSSPEIEEDEAEGVLRDVTAISDLPSDEEDDRIADRYRARKPVKTIRSDSGNYTRSDELFEGKTPDMRRAKKSAVRMNIKAPKKGVDIMTKARAMEKSREIANKKMLKRNKA